MANLPKNTRKCCACRVHGNKSEMIRFVKTENGVVVDYDKTSGGRGVWVHDNPDCLEKLIKKKMLNAAFKAEVGEEIYSELKCLITKRRDI